MQFKFAVMSLVLSLAISGCQNTQNNSKIIAGAFNASTNIQKKFIERHAPENIKVTRNIQYMETPSLHFDLYQPENIAELASYLMSEKARYITGTTVVVGAGFIV